VGKSQRSTPKISVITVVKNRPDDLEKTIQSVTAQDYPEVEYIVVDGGSGEDTLRVIRKYESQITHWVSETDRSPYDGMNKGVALASGQWINFMNAGDAFYRRDTISNLFARKTDDIDVLYGDYLADYEYFKAFRKSRPVTELWKGMVICHQAVFIRTELIRSYPFDLTYPIGADLDQLYRIFKDKKRFFYLSLPVAVFSAGGISSRHMVKTAREHTRIVKRYHSLSKREQIYHFRFFIEVSLATLTYRIIPERFMLKMLKQFNRQLLVEE